MDIVALKLDVMDVIARYAHTFDGRNPEAFLDLFADDGIIGIKRKQEEALQWQGKGELQDYISHAYAERGDDQPRHHVRNTIFLEITADRVTTSTYFLATLAPGKGGLAKVTASGIFKDEMVFIADGWKIKKRTVLYD